LEEIGVKLYSAAELFESLKDYVSKALISTIDHLGSVTSKVDAFLDENIDEAFETNLRVLCIQQIPKYHKQYLLPDGRFSEAIQVEKAKAESSGLRRGRNEQNSSEFSSGSVAFSFASVSVVVISLFENVTEPRKVIIEYLEDTAYLCLNFTKDHEGTRFNTPWKLMKMMTPTTLLTSLRSKGTYLTSRHLCKAFNEFNYLLKIDTNLFTFDIKGIKTYEEYELNNNMTGDLEEPWSDNGPRDDITTIKRRRHDIHGDGVRDSATTSGCGRLKVDLEPSTWRLRQEYKATLP
ncbi:ABIL3-like protein isoform X2, partial [Tanacetum coccineum]